MNEKIFLYLLDAMESNREIRPFFQQVPALQQAESDCSALIDQVNDAMGFEFSDQLEEKIVRYMDLSVQAYYLLGLGLRRDILEAMLEQ